MSRPRPSDGNIPTNSLSLGFWIAAGRRPPKACDSGPKALGRLLLAGALFLCAAAPAQTWISNQPVSQSLALKVAFEPGESFGGRQIIRERIRCGTNEFLFVVPEDMRSETRQDNTVVLTSLDATFYMTLRITGPLPAETDEDQARLEWVAGHFPNSTNIEKFAASVGGKPGQGMQLRYASPGGGNRLARILWVPCNAGILEFILNADAEKAKTAQQLFDTVLLTFRSNEQGKIEILHFSERS
jgi:hypothetical protein